MGLSLTRKTLNKVTITHKSGDKITIQIQEAHEGVVQLLFAEKQQADGTYNFNIERDNVRKKVKKYGK